MVSAEAVIVEAQVAPGHDGAAELVLRLRHPNGADEVVRVDAEVGFRLMQNCGVAEVSGLAGHPWRRMLNGG